MGRKEAVMGMTRKLMACGIALAIGAGVAWAQASSGGPQTGPMGTPRGESDRSVTAQQEGTYSEGNLRTVTMTVRKVDPSHHKATLDVQVSPEANITANGQPIKLDQLKEGDQVRASFDMATGDVVKIQVTQKGTKSK